MANLSNEVVINILNIYFEEWKYRCENFWKRFNQFTIVTFFASTMPITFRIFEGLVLPEISLVFFPVCGIILSLLCLFLCWSEASRLISSDLTIKKIIKDLGKDEFEKESLSLFKNKILKKFQIFNWRIGIWVPLVATIFTDSSCGYNNYFN